VTVYRPTTEKDVADAIDRLANTALKIKRDRDALLEALRDLLTAHHHSRGDEYVDAAYKAIQETERD
jgi:hypothetical protein